MEANAIDFVVGQLEATPRSEWDHIAVESGVPRSTIEKVVYRITKRPSFETIDSLEKVLRRRRNGAPA